MLFWNCNYKKMIDLNFDKEGKSNIKENSLVKINSIYKEKKGENIIKVIGATYVEELDETCILFTISNQNTKEFLFKIGQDYVARNQNEYKIMCNYDFFKSLELKYLTSVSNLSKTYKEFNLVYLREDSFLKGLVIDEKICVGMDSEGISNLIYGSFITRKCELILDDNNNVFEKEYRWNEINQVIINEKNLIKRVGFKDMELISELLKKENLEKDFEYISNKYPILKELYEIYKEHNGEKYDLFKFSQDLIGSSELFVFDNKNGSVYRKMLKKNMVFHIFKVENNLTHVQKLALVNINVKESPIYIDFDEILN